MGQSEVAAYFAREIDRATVDADLQPARLTVDILRRVSMEPVRVHALLVRSGRRIEMPPLPEKPDQWPDSIPMFVQPYGRDPDSDDKGFAWQHDGRRCAWVYDFRELVKGAR